MEIWKDVEGYEGFYEVSNFGNVRSVERYVTRSDGVVQRRKAAVKKQFMNHDGYLTVHLCKNGISERVGTHLLVAKAFVDGKFDGAEVNHKNFDRADNRPENLEWITHRDNVRYTINAGRHICNTDLRGSNNSNYGNHKLSKIYADNAALSKEKQSRPGSQNGRALGVEMVSPDGCVIEFGYIRMCAKYLSDNNLVRAKTVTAIANNIGRALKGGYDYCGYKFIAI